MPLLPGTLQPAHLRECHHEMLHKVGGHQYLSPLLPSNENVANLVAINARAQAGTCKGAWQARRGEAGEAAGQARVCGCLYVRAGRDTGLAGKGLAG